MAIDIKSYNPHNACKYECYVGIMVELRQYQKDAIETVKQNFIHKDRQYIEMPTGSGKTVTFLSYARELNKKVLVVVPSKELLNQVVNFLNSVFRTRHEFVGKFINSIS